MVGKQQVLLKQWGPWGLGYEWYSGVKLRKEVVIEVMGALRDSESCGVLR